MDEAIYERLARRLADGQPSALATVVRTRGSTPQQAGAKAIFTPEGGVVGTIGGGCLENEARLRALEALRDGRPVLLDIDLTHDYDQQTGLICGGRADVFIEVPAPAQAEWFAHLSAWRASRLACAVATVVAPAEATPGRRALVCESGERLGDAALEPAAREGLRLRESGLRESEAGQVYVDLLLPPERLWIAGAGHVGRALAHHAAAVGFDVRVVDDRPDLNCPANIPEAGEHLVGSIEPLLAGRRYGPEDYVVVVTRGHQHDGEALRAVIGSEARYLGLIGSRRKIKLLTEGLIDEGVAAREDFARLFAPIGLDIGARTVDEIAIAIVAELIAVRHGRLDRPDQRPPFGDRAKAHGPCAGAADG